MLLSPRVGNLGRLKDRLTMHQISLKVRTSANVVFYLYLEAQIVVPCLTKVSSSGVSKSINNRNRQIEKIKDEINKLKVSFFKIV